MARRRRPIASMRLLKAAATNETANPSATETAITEVQPSVALQQEFIAMELDDPDQLPTDQPKPRLSLGTAGQKAPVPAPEEDSRPQVNQAEGRPMAANEAERGKPKLDEEAQKREKEAERERQRQEREAEKAKSNQIEKRFDEKERQRQEQEAEEERQKQEKEAEKERLRMEKEAEREAQRQEKERERQQQREEKEQQKVGKKRKSELAGFGTERTIKESRVFQTVLPRRPFAKDANIDYTVMEDEEWEPEPEGDSLSDWGNEAAAEAAPKARSKPERPADLIPELLQFLKDHPEIKAVHKAVQAFCAAHADRKIVKTWLAERIKELAEKSGGRWRIKAEAPSSPAPQPDAGPPKGAEQPQAKPGALLKFLSKAAHGDSPASSSNEAEKESDLIH